jgi:hypothetical protein
MRILRMTILMLLMVVGLWGQTATLPSLQSPGEPNSAGNPYLIANLENLYWIAADGDQDGFTETERRAFHYRQIDNIDASETETWDGKWLPIGRISSLPFTGSYNGAGHTISGIHVSRPTSSGSGLFGYVQSANQSSMAKIMNLGVTGGTIAGHMYTGGLVGYSQYVVIENCYSTNTVSADQNGTGGLLGLAFNYTEVRNSYSTGNVTGDNYTGGLVGITQGGGLIENCYSTGNVTRISSGSYENIGGFVGSITTGSITNSYSTGSVTYTDATDPVNKGFEGYKGSAAISNSFWDTETSSQSSSYSVQATGKTTTQMKTQSTFTDAGWDLTSVWKMDGDSYPSLRAGDPVEAPTTQASAVLFSSTSYNSTTISWTNGDGSKRVLFMKAGNSGTASPVNNTAYTANTVFGSGSQIASSGWFCVYNGTGTTVDITGLSPSTEYIIHVLEYKGGLGMETYLAGGASGNPATLTTGELVAPTTQASNISFSAVENYSFSISWNNGNGEKRALFIKADNSGTAAPADQETYTANTTFGQGSQIGSTGWYCAYNGTGTSVSITGLSHNTDYIAIALEYNGIAGYEKYLQSGAANNPKVQKTSEVQTPGTQASNILFSDIDYTEMTLSWTIGNGEKRAVFMKAGDEGTADPINTTTYTAESVFGNGTQISSSGWFCVYNGTGTDVAVSGLDHSTAYRVQVFEYNGKAGDEDYLKTSATDNPATESTLTLSVPTVQAHNISFPSVKSNQASIAWTSGNGDKRVVFIKEGSTGTASPSDDATYTANSAFGSGSELSDWYCIYNGTGSSVTVTGLNQGTGYILQVFEYSGNPTSEKYLTSAADNNPRAFRTTAGGVTYNFSNCSATGKTGPTQEQADAAYSGSNLEGNVTVSGGIQAWTVPATGTYTIEAAGARGGSWTGSDPVYGGKGAKITGDFALTEGTTLYILVGQKGVDKSGTPSYNGSGGGGGTYIYTSGAEEPLMAAGGGGGSYAHGAPGTRTSGTDGSDGTSGTSVRNAEGGSSGTGGGINANYAGGGGAGFLGNGYTGNYGGEGGKKPGDTGIGGAGYSPYGTEGGFGGGGGGSCAGGGGGGYSGGAGGVYSQDYYGGGGGGSYNAGTNPVNLAGVNEGHGYLIISRSMETVAFSDGSTFPPTAIPGNGDQAIGRFHLAASGNGATLTAASIKLNGNRSGASNFKLWYSSDAAFDNSSDTQLGSAVAEDPGVGNTITFSSLSQAIATGGGGYFFLTCDVAADAGGAIEARLVDENSLTITGAELVSPINNAPLSGSDVSLPVTLAAFTAKATKAGVLLEWSTSAEIENAGFIIRRQVAGDRNQENGETENGERDTEETQGGLPLLEGEDLPASSGQAGGVLASYLTHPSLVGQGSVTKSTHYSFTDSKVEPGKTYIYTLSDVDFSGKETALESVTLRLRSGSAIVADNYSLMPVYPNPFNASFTVPFSLNENITVKITLYNIAGQQVMTILNQELSAGEYHFAVNADDLSSGVYFVKTNFSGTSSVSQRISDRKSHTQKIVLMK